MLSVLLSGSTAHAIVSTSAFGSVVVLAVCLFLGLALKKHKIYFLPEAAATMIVGFAVGCGISAFNPSAASVVTFNPEVFFFALLPPIIFEAGYTLNRSDFFSNLGSIMLYAIVGTVISTAVFSLLLFMAVANGVVPLDSGSPIETLQFGALVSATDTVATIAILSAAELAADPLLYSLVFGESVLNDAVAIVLYNTFQGFHDSEFKVSTLFEATLLFLGVSLGSALTGLAISLVCCFVFKFLNFSEYPVYEFTIIALFAYCSYFLAELFHLSGIMAIFFCAVGLAHYNYYNISSNARIATHDAFKSIAQICDTLIFVYMGVTAGVSVGPNADVLIYSPAMIFLSVIFMLIARAANIFFLTMIANPNRTLQVPFRMQLCQWFAGMRGSVAFALALNFPGDNNPYIVTTTLAIVILSTLVVGAGTLPVLTKAGMTNSNIAGNEEVVNKRYVVKKFVAWWLVFDKNYMKKWFGDPEAREDRHHEVSSRQFETGIDAADRAVIEKRLRSGSTGASTTPAHGHSHGGGGHAHH